MQDHFPIFNMHFHAIRPWGYYRLSTKEVARFLVFPLHLRGVSGENADLVQICHFFDCKDLKMW